MKKLGYTPLVLILRGGETMMRKFGWAVVIMAILCGGGYGDESSAQVQPVITAIAWSPDGQYVAVGRYDGSYGTYLKGEGDGRYRAVSNRQVGLYLEGEVREMLPIRVGNKNLLLVAKNNGPLHIIEY